MIFTKTFDCGLKMVLKRTPSPVSYSALTIKSGTRNEPKGKSGIAHMTEHMLFKGTARRNPQEISDRLELLGGELNAYTTKEETVIYSAVLKEDTSKAVDLMMEMAFTSSFLENELDKERQVIIDEINMYKDSPSDCIFDDFEKMLYGEHPLARPILGSAASLRKIRSADLKAYTRTNFRPETMCISITGNITPQRAEKIVAESIRRYVPDGYEPSPASSPALEGGSLSAGTAFISEISKKNHQTNCIIGTSAYSYYDEDRLTLILLSNMLGGPATNSILNQLLREKNALVYTVESIYVPFADTGSMLIYFGCEKQNTERCLELIYGELEKLRSTPVPDKKLAAAKKQLLGQLAISSDNGEAQALAIGKSMTVFGRIMPDEEVRSKINAISADRLQNVARTLFSPERLSRLIYK
ncbi:MAG: insulinase family protein [Bacteroidales bacterium]|nr:insulinase family protein [Bacteroidales bacterium]